MNPEASHLAELQHALARTHRARVRRRRALGAAAVALPTLAITLSAWQFFGGTGFQPVAPPVASSPTSTSAPSVASALEVASPIHNQQSEVGNPTITPMSDDELLVALAEVGQPSGLVRVNGETFVVANTIPDADAASPLAPLLTGLEPHP